MLRISGVVLPQHKHIRIALREIYGIGHTRAMHLCEKLGINPATKVKDIDESTGIQLQEAVNEYEIEGDLKRRVAMNIKRLIDIKAYRGIRHRRGLPVRGQRTCTNARTRKGRKGGNKGQSSASKG